MALIQCPECGQEISDKARKCIHCGTNLTSDTKSQNICTECGKEIDLEARECPFCGCPTQFPKSENSIVEKEGNAFLKKKKTISIIAIIATVILAIFLIVKFGGTRLNKHEQLAYQNVVSMKNMMRDPDSFKLYDYILLLESMDKSGNVEHTYTIFKYGGTNSYGAIVTQEAIFEDSDYIMDYGDEPENDRQFRVRAELAVYMLTVGGKDCTFRTINVDVGKIKGKMGLN